MLEILKNMIIALVTMVVKPVTLKEVEIEYSIVVYTTMLPAVTFDIASAAKNAYKKAEKDREIARIQSEEMLAIQKEEDFRKIVLDFELECLDSCNDCQDGECELVMKEDGSLGFKNWRFKISDEQIAYIHSHSMFSHIELNENIIFAELDRGYDKYILEVTKNEATYNPMYVNKDLYVLTHGSLNGTTYLDLNKVFQRNYVEQCKGIICCNGFYQINNEKVYNKIACKHITTMRIAPSNNGNSVGLYYHNILELNAFNINKNIKSFKIGDKIKLRNLI